MTNLTRRSLLAIAAFFPVAARAADHQVTIQNFAFSPKTLNVAAGDTVTFINKDGAPHTATADDGAFDTGTLQSGQSKAVTIPAGNHSYVCKFHGNMKGAVNAS